MASYDFAFFVTYFDFAGGIPMGSGGLKTYEDSVPFLPWPIDLGFQVGEMVHATSPGPSGTYIGKYQYNGKTLAVLEEAGPGGSIYHLLSEETPFDSANFPPIFTGANAALVDPVTFITCFLTGTLVRTTTCETAVEELQIGDHILTNAGGEVAIKWIGRQAVSTRFGAAERLMPVRFVAGSLGDGLPNADLTVTADHGMLVDGVICHASALVNGTTITRVPLAEMGKTFTVYHIETENHEIILANGAPAETFIDNVSRRAFDNFAEFEALYGDVPEMEELPYPRAMSSRQVPAHVQRRLQCEMVA